jgi:Protein of unknown function (DUF2510)
VQSDQPGAGGTPPLHYPGAPPGWYPDPAGSPARRWWDGYQWHAALDPAPPGAPPLYRPVAPTAVAPTSEIVTAYVAEHRAMHAGQLGAFGLGAVWLLTLLLFSINAVPLHHFALAFDHSIRASQKHQPYTTPQLPGNMTVLTDLALGFWAAAMTVLLVFQHRAAKVARLLRFPAKISPGLGVGAWFIPVAWYWLPYQSLAGCLPPEDPHRAELLRCWLLLCAGITLGTAGLFLVPYAKEAGWIVCGLAALAWIGYLTMAPRIVVAIESAHREAIGPSALAQSGVNHQI